MPTDNNKNLLDKIYMTTNGDFEPFSVFPYVISMDCEVSSICKELNKKKTIKVPMPKKYIINKGATVLIWDNGEKTVVKRCEDDEFNKRLGFLTAFFQHYSGMSKNKANKFLAELEVEDEEKEEVKETNSKNKFRVGDKVKFRKNIKDTYGIDESRIDKMKNKIFEIIEISEPYIGKNFYSYYTSIGCFVREDMIEKGDK